MRITKLLLILLLSFAGTTATIEAKAQPGVSVSFNTFYNELGRYGRWVDHPRYGQVWIYDQPDFRPYYTDGHWEYTDFGWEWVSDYDWGWGPFHYGRWEEDPSYGWMWIPGYDWAPAWVSWSQYDDYYGWAPLGYGVGLDVSVNMIPSSWWVFAPRAYITSPMIGRYCVPFDRSRYFYRNAAMIHNYYDRGGRRFMMGPERGEVERFTHARIEPRRIDNDRFEWHGQGNRGDAFRPNEYPRRNETFNGRRDGFPLDNRGIQNQRPENGWRNNDNGWRNNNIPNRPADNNPPQSDHWRRGGFNNQPNPQVERPQNAPVQQPRPEEPRNDWRNSRPPGAYNNGNFQRQQNNNPAPAPRPQQQPNFGGGGWHDRAPQQNDHPSQGNNNARGRFSERRG